MFIQGYESIPIKETVMNILNELYERIEQADCSLGFKVKLKDELEWADRLGIDTEEGQFHIRRVINTLDTL